MRVCRVIIAVVITAMLNVACTDKQTTFNHQDLKPYPEEEKAALGRGLVALPMDNNQVFLSWRLLPKDSPGTTFRLYRTHFKGQEPYRGLIFQSNGTSFIDSGLQENVTYTYTIIPVYNGNIGEQSNQVQVVTSEKGRASLIFDIGQDFKQVRVATGDLTGDGELEVITVYSNNKHLDPVKEYWEKAEDTIKVAAFLHTGERLWTIDLGWGIEPGGVYSPVVVWDIDADGRAEVLLKTNKSENPRDYKSERLSILDGETGKIIREAEWPVIIGRYADDYNNNSRNFIAVAHLDGKYPYIIVARGLYKTQVIWAYDRKLNIVWQRTLGKDMYNPINNKWLKKIKIRAIWNRLYKDRYRGSHSLPIADVNEDGAEEILWGEHCIGPGGKDIWKVEDRMPYVGHPDIVFAADVIPSIKGKEIYYCREGWRDKEDNVGMLLVNNQGKTIWAQWGYTHIDGGWVAKLLQNQDGMQCYGYDISKKKWNKKGAAFGNLTGFLWNFDGKLIANPPKSWLWSFPVDWDGDGVREICQENGDIRKFNGPVVAKLGSGVLQWGADLFGDHREEVLIAKNRNVYILFNTDSMKSPPKVTRIADRQYRNDLSRTAMQFNVIPTESGFIPFDPNRIKVSKTRSQID